MNAVELIETEKAKYADAVLTEVPQSPRNVMFQSLSHSNMALAALYPEATLTDPLMEMARAGMYLVAAMELIMAEREAKR